MATDPPNAQTEQAFVALVEVMSAQLIPDLTAKLNDHTVDHQAAVDAALTQLSVIEKQVATVHATATRFGVNPTGPLGQRVIEMASAIWRARATLEDARKAAAEVKPAAAPAPPPPPPPPAAPPPYPITAEDVLKQLHDSTDPGQMMINAENAIIGERRAAIDGITERILNSYKK
ncbi:MAG TPA: hypothetical protein VGU66_14380 [Candidatus Elarobacter sp.]|nr:hypothetical protein [Candidatus Elarobacter sp.]